MSVSGAHEAVALEELAAMWAGAYYDLRFERGQYRARFRYDDTELEAATLDGLESLFRAHFSRWTAL